MRRSSQAILSSAGLGRPAPDLDDTRLSRSDLTFSKKTLFSDESWVGSLIPVEDLSSTVIQV